MKHIKTYSIFEKKEKETLLLSAFPGTGKSYLFKNNKDLKILDSDSSKFDKKDFPENYIKHIKDNIGKADIICISSHEEVRKALVKNNLDFTLAYPDIKLKDEYLERYKERGSDEKFIKLLSDNWDGWIKDLEKQKGCKNIKLKKGEYLADAI